MYHIYTIRTGSRDTLFKKLRTRSRRKGILFNPFAPAKRFGTPWLQERRHENCGGCDTLNDFPSIIPGIDGKGAEQNH